MRQFRILEGDALAVLGTLAGESVQTCITSPPYWGLRDYGTARWAGGDAECDHKSPMADIGHIAHSTLDGGKSTNAAQIRPYRDICGKCGAARIDAQIGLERTPDEYVARLVAVFREVRRVLRADGTAWVNLGDSYATNGYKTYSGQPLAQSAASTRGGAKKVATLMMDLGSYEHGLKPKDLVGIPWRVAFALQADGWYLRSDIVWHKPNPMPESVTDRPTKAHEYIFLLAKSERYFYDADAVREPHTDPNVVDGKYRNGANGGVNASGYAPKTQGFVSGGGGIVMKDREYNPLGRNRRSVWTQSTQSFEGAHFATFPEELIRPCVLAGCPLGGVVLDPFAGSGTTGVVALGLDRGFVGIELNATYAAMARGRIAGDQPLFNAEAQAQELAWTR